MAQDSVGPPDSQYKIIDGVVVRIDKLQWAQAAAREIAFALNRSHCTGDEIHEVSRALLGDAGDLADSVDRFEKIVAPIIHQAYINERTLQP